MLIRGRNESYILCTLQKTQIKKWNWILDNWLLLSKFSSIISALGGISYFPYSSFSFSSLLPSWTLFSRTSLLIFLASQASVSCYSDSGNNSQIYVILPYREVSLFVLLLFHAYSCPILGRWESCMMVACRFPLFKKAMKEIFKQNLIYNRYSDIKNERRNGWVDGWIDVLLFCIICIISMPAYYYNQLFCCFYSPKPYSGRLGLFYVVTIILVIGNINCISITCRHFKWTYVMHAESLQSCPTLCDPMDCSPPGPSVHGIL